MTCSIYEFNGVFAFGYPDRPHPSVCPVEFGGRPVQKDPPFRIPHVSKNQVSLTAGFSSHRNVLRLVQNYLSRSNDAIVVEPVILDQGSDLGIQS